MFVFLTEPIKVTYRQSLSYEDLTEAGSNVALVPLSLQGFWKSSFLGLKPKSSFCFLEKFLRQKWALPKGGTFWRQGGAGYFNLAVKIQVKFLKSSWGTTLVYIVKYLFTC